MPERVIDLGPGGMLSDVVENAIGNEQHQLVQNLRQRKSGKWETPTPYKQLISGQSSINALIEVTEDATGDRFLLFQDDQALKRVDYHSTNGYAGQSPTTITLPSGVTIGASAVLSFYYYRGIVRITGASKPLWYGYVDRNLFGKTDSAKWESKPLDDPAPTRLIPDSATVDYSDEQTDSFDQSVKITQNASDGAVCFQFFLQPTKLYYATARFYKATAGGAANVRMLIGTSRFSSDIDAENSSAKDAWTDLQDGFTPSADNVFVTFNPGSGASSDVAYLESITITRQDGTVVNALQVQGWQLQKAELDPLEAELDNSSIAFSYTMQQDDTETRRLDVQYFYIYDGGQYSLLNSFTLENGVVYFPPNWPNGNRTRLKVRIPYLTAAAMPPRVTGIGICVAWYNDEDTTRTYKVVKTFDFTQDLPVLRWLRTKLYFKTTNNTRAYLMNDTLSGDTFHQFDGYLANDHEVLLSNTNGDLHASVSNFFLGGGNSSNFVEFDQSLAPITLTGGLNSEYLADTLITMQPAWRYDSTGIYTFISFDNDSGTDFYEFTGLPENTDDNTPDYAHHVVIGNRAYVTSNAPDEGDFVRYSPINQFDSFPIINLFDTETGDTDSIKAIVEHQGRLVLLKSNSVSNGGFTGTNFFKNLEFARAGIYAERGYLVINGILYWMGKTDIYAYSGGVQPTSLLEKAGMRQYYLENVTTDSIIAYNKEEGEIWFILSDTVMVWDMELNKWYIRDTLTLNNALLDIDERLIAASSGQIVLYNHAEAGDETINWLFRTQLWDQGRKRYHKKLSALYMDAQSSGNIAAELHDGILSKTTTKTITPDANDVEGAVDRPNFLFKELRLTVSGSGTAIIEKMRLVVQEWRQ